MSPPRLAKQQIKVTQNPVESHKSKYYAAAAEVLGGKLLPDRQDNGKMVILRTFCGFDVDKLADGFDSWVSYFPCGGPDAHPDALEVDILLYFRFAEKQEETHAQQ